MTWAQVFMEGAVLLSLPSTVSQMFAGPCWLRGAGEMPLNKVPGSLGCLWPGGGGLRLREGTFTFHCMSFSSISFCLKPWLQISMPLVRERNISPTECIKTHEKR